MFFNRVYFLQQPLIFVVVTLLLLRYNLPYSDSSTSKASIKNRIYITLYRNTDTIILLTFSKGDQDVFINNMSLILK